MRLHILQHVAFEGAGSILPWAERHGYPVSITKFFESGWQLPEVAAIDALVVMGGPMGVHDDAAHAWLAEEKAFIRACIDAGKRVVGICLGAQLAAQVLGADVKANGQKEIGWFPVFKLPVPSGLLWDMPQELVVLHWHGDTFSLPEGALQLVRSEACEQQMFVWRDQVLGIQFHLEMDAEAIDTMLDYCGKEVKEPAGFVQGRKAIREGAAACGDMMLLLDSILTRFLG